jgi:hypothetical protein
MIDCTANAQFHPGQIVWVPLPIPLHGCHSIKLVGRVIKVFGRHICVDTSEDPTVKLNPSLIRYKQISVPAQLLT